MDSDSDSDNLDTDYEEPEVVNGSPLKVLKGKKYRLVCVRVVNYM